MPHPGAWREAKFPGRLSTTRSHPAVGSDAGGYRGAKLRLGLIGMAAARSILFHDFAFFIMWRLGFVYMFENKLFYS
jgi:hypothetical protein